MAHGFGGPRGDRMEVHRWPLVEGYAAGPVCLDDLVTVFAEYDPRHRWNGWLMPRMDPWSVEKVLAAWQAADAGREDAYRLTHAWDDDGTLVVTECPDLDGEESVDRYVPNEDGLYSLGAGAWVWSEDTDDDAQQLALAACLCDAVLPCPIHD